MPRQNLRSSTRFREELLNTTSFDDGRCLDPMHFRRVLVELAVGVALSVRLFVEAVDGLDEGLLEGLVERFRVLVGCCCLM